MKIAYLANANNYHTQKWTTWFASKGHEILVASLEKPTQLTLDTSPPEVIYVWLNNNADRSESTRRKLSYLSTVPKLRTSFLDFQPDIIHAHYASSYGFLAALCFRGGYFLSTWGTDVFSFPKKGPIHKAVLKYAINSASQTISTSHVMKKEISSYTVKDIEVIPFGVDTSFFVPRTRSDCFTITLVKALDNKYGIDTLLLAISSLRDNRPDFQFEVRIAGTGVEEEALKSLSSSLRLEDKVKWLGYIDQPTAALEWGRATLAVIPSREESFGVSAIEAMSCATPLIVTDAPGLQEVTSDGKYAKIVPKDNPSALTLAIEEAIDNYDQYVERAGFAREHVSKHYDIDECFTKVLSLYRNKTSVATENQHDE